MQDQFVDKVRQAAEAYFADGLFCAESVVLAVADELGLASEVLPKAATAFCSGLARTCGPCGALSGAVMGIGLAMGRSTAEQSVEACYAATRRLIADFEQSFGARDCHVLLGCDLATPEGQARFCEQRLGERCAQYVSRAAETAARIIAAADS